MSHLQSGVKGGSESRHRTLVVIQPDGTEERIPYKSREPALELLQKLVGGYIELLRVRYEGKIRTAYVNEEGLLNGLPENDVATRITREFGHTLPIVGTLVIDLPKASS